MEHFGAWSCSPVSAPIAEAPLPGNCSETLSKLCRKDPTYSKGEVCMSTCNSQECPVSLNWNNEYKDHFNSWPKSQFSIQEDPIKRINQANLTDYLSYFGVTDEPSKNQVNCWLECQAESRCIGYSWDDSAQECRLFDNMTIINDSKGFTESIGWVCNTDTTFGNKCDWYSVLSNPSLGVNGYQFYPDPSCPIFECGNPEPDITGPPTAPTEAPTEPPTSAPVPAPTASPTLPVTIPAPVTAPLECIEYIKDTDDTNLMCMFQKTNTEVLDPTDQGTVFTVAADNSLLTFINSKISDGSGVFFNILGGIPTSDPIGVGMPLFLLGDYNVGGNKVEFERELSKKMVENGNSNLVIVGQNIFNYVNTYFPGPPDFGTPETNKYIYVFLDERINTPLPMTGTPPDNYLEQYVALDSEGNPIDVTQAPVTPPNGKGGFRGAVAEKTFTLNGPINNFNGELGDYLAPDDNRFNFGFEQPFDSAQECIDYCTNYDESGYDCKCVTYYEDTKTCQLFDNCDYTISDPTANTYWNTNTIDSISDQVPPFFPPYSKALTGCVNVIDNFNNITGSSWTGEFTEQECYNRVSNNINRNSGDGNYPYDWDIEIENILNGGFNVVSWDPNDKSCSYNTYGAEAVFTPKEEGNKGCVMEDSCNLFGNYSSGSKFYANWMNESGIYIDFNVNLTSDALILDNQDFKIDYNSGILKFRWNTSSGFQETVVTVSGQVVVKAVYFYNKQYDDSTNATLYFAATRPDNSYEYSKTTVTNPITPFNMKNEVVIGANITDLNICGATKVPDSKCVFETKSFTANAPSANTDAPITSAPTPSLPFSDSTWVNWGSGSKFGLNFKFTKFGDGTIMNCDTDWVVKVVGSKLVFNINSTDYSTNYNLTDETSYTLNILVKDTDLVIYIKEGEYQYYTTISAINTSSFDNTVTLVSEILDLNICGGSVTDAPTFAPTNAPTEAPTSAPTNAPTPKPTIPPGLSYLPTEFTVYQIDTLNDESDETIVANEDGNRVGTFDEFDYPTYPTSRSYWEFVYVGEVEGVHSFKMINQTFNKAIKITGDGREEVYLTDGDDWTPIGVHQAGSSEYVRLSCWINVQGMKRKYWYIGGFTEDILEIGTEGDVWVLAPDSRGTYNQIVNKQLQYPIVDGKGYYITINQNRDDFASLNTDYKFVKDKNVKWVFTFKRVDEFGLNRYEIKNTTDNQPITFTTRGTVYNEFAIFRYISSGNIGNGFRIVLPHPNGSYLYVMNCPNNVDTDFKFIRKPLDLFTEQSNDSPFKDDTVAYNLPNIIYTYLFGSSSSTNNFVPFFLEYADYYFPDLKNNSPTFTQIDKLLGASYGTKNNLNFNSMLNSYSYNSNPGITASWTYPEYASRNFVVPDTISIAGRNNNNTFTSVNGDTRFSYYTNPIEPTLKQDAGLTKVYGLCSDWCYYYRNNVDHENNYLWANIERDLNVDDLYGCSCVYSPKTDTIETDLRYSLGRPNPQFSSFKVDPNARPSNQSNEFERISWSRSVGECFSAVDSATHSGDNFTSFSGDLDSWQLKVINECNSKCAYDGKLFSNAVFSSDTVLDKCICYNECLDRHELDVGTDTNKSIETQVAGANYTKINDKECSNLRSVRLADGLYNYESADCSYYCSTMGIGKLGRLVTLHYSDNDIIFDDSGYLKAGQGGQSGGLVYGPNVDDYAKWIQLDVNPSWSGDNNQKYIFINYVTKEQMYVIGTDNSSIRLSKNPPSGSLTVFYKTTFEGVPVLEIYNSSSYVFDVKQNIVSSNIPNDFPICTGYSWNESSKSCTYYFDPIINQYMTNSSGTSCNIKNAT
jgi:hypothetical protein